VKKVIETRLETGDLIRVFSEYQFKKSMKLPVVRTSSSITVATSAYSNILTMSFAGRRIRGAEAGRHGVRGERFAPLPAHSSIPPWQ
jgi:hypothetical protein